MSRSPRRLAAAATVTAALAAVALPASAATTDPRDVSVFVSQSPGSRLFDVLDTANLPLTTLDFRPDADGALPFKTVVTDDALPLSTPGYQVSAVMSNLYYVNPDGTLDLGSKIDSSDVSLGFGSPLSVPALELPVDPSVLLGGALNDCTVLNLSLAQLLTDPLFSVLCPLLTGLGSRAVPAGTVAGATTQVLDLADLTLASAGQVLDLATLPFALTGQQEIGAFTSPARYDVVPYDDNVDGAMATSKRIMTGTPSVLTTVTGIVDDALEAQVLSGALDVLPTDATPSLVSSTDLLAALRSAPGLSTVVNLIDDLLPAQITAMLSNVTGTLQPVLTSALSTVNANYVGNPVLKAAPTATKAGDYKGRLTVTFFQQ